ncbi:MAG: glycosyltransferase family 9 protein [Bdellovibrionota bacterium]|jgi:heptosyltransferase I
MTDHSNNLSHVQGAISSILVVLTGSLGDLVRGFAILKPLKEQLPQAKVTWLVEDKWKSIAQRISGIDKLMVFERKRGLAGVKQIIKELKASKFDVTLDMQRHLKSGFFSYLSGSKRRVGFHPKNAKEFNYLFNTEYIPRCENDFPKIYHYMKFVEQLGLTWEEPLDFGFNLSTVKKDDSIAIVLGSSKVEKDWPKERYTVLIKQIVDKLQRKVVLLGDSSQKAAAEEIVTKCQSVLIDNKVGQTTLPQLVDLLANAHVALGPDSGPGHIAAAVGTPYIAFFGPTEVRRVAPYRCEEFVIQAETGRVSDIEEEVVFNKLLTLL